MSYRYLPTVSLRIDGRTAPLRVYEASRFFPRARGLLGAERLREDEALWIRPCGSVHTIGMRYAIDVIFLDRQLRVVGVENHVAPLRFARHRRAHSTIELLAGVAAAIALAVGVQVQAAAPQPGLTPIATQYVQAEQSFRAGDLARAEQLYSKILEAHGDEPLAWFRIGLIQQRRHSFRAALNAYDSALAWAPGDSSADTTRVLAKVRFNRALLLLESAAHDLKGIAPGLLDRELDATREVLIARVDSALLSADAPVTSESAGPAVPVAPPSPAKGFVYEVKQPVVTVAPVEEHPP